MNRIHIVGRKNCGKTSLVVDLVRELASRKLRVATIKHTHHQHELDTPGKDSWHHRQAGAELVGVLSRNVSAIFLPQHANMEKEDRYSELEPMFSRCDVVLVEGNLATTAPKIEVWRASQGQDPIYPTETGIQLFVSNDAYSAANPPASIRRESVAEIADWILEQLQR